MPKAEPGERVTLVKVSLLTTTGCELSIEAVLPEVSMSKTPVADAVRGCYERLADAMTTMGFIST